MAGNIQNAIDAGLEIKVSKGGTGTTSLTNHGVLVGSGTSSITALAVGATNQVLLGSTGADPTWGAVDLTTDITGTLPVGNGGIGTTTLTDHGVLIGSGAGAVTAASVGSTGELLVGATGSDPAFGTSANGDFTFTSSTAASTRILTVTNTDDTDTGSGARVTVQSGGASGGDPTTRYAVTGVTAWLTGIDNSDTDAFKISQDNSDIGTSNYFKITRNGEITKPSQPAFLAYLGTTDSNATGDGTSFKLGSGNALTEVFDQNSDFNTNGTFTAPITGRYMFTASARFDDVTSSHNTTYIQINTSNGTYTQLLLNGGSVTIPGDVLIQPCMAFVDMDASDTADIQIIANGSTKTVDIVSLGRGTFFAGYLVC